jgi:hypothetical protein
MSHDPIYYITQVLMINCSDTEINSKKYKTGKHNLTNKKKHQKQIARKGTLPKEVNRHIP